MKTAIAWGVLLGLTSLPVLAQQTKAPACDRHCLEGFVDRYLEAMLARKVSDDLFARDTKFTENGVRLPLGKHRITVERTGYFPYDAIIEADDRPISLDIKLTPIPD